MFNFLYFSFLISIIFGGSIYVGPVSVRQIFAMLVFLSLLFHMNKINKFWDKYIALYFLFILFYGISSYMENSMSDYIRAFISKYMVCIIGYFATRRYLDRIKSYCKIINVMICCGLFNSIVTILQYMRNPIGLALGALSVNFNNEVEYYMFQHMADGDRGSVLFGMMSNGVYNGYFTMIMPLLILYYIYEDKQYGYLNAFKKLFCWAAWLFFMFCSFIIQERAPFIVAALLSVYVILRKSEHKFFLIYAAVFLGIFIIPIFLESHIWQNSRLFFKSEFVTDTRIEIFSLARSFILTNTLFGGIRTATSMIGNMPHNFIFNAFIYGGIIGGITILYIIFNQLKRSIILLKNEFSYMMPLSLLAYTLNGLTHNPSIITGEVIMWIMWGCVQFDYYRFIGSGK